MGLERRAGQPWRLRGPLGSGVPPSAPSATKEADHAQVERSAAARVARTEPAPDRPRSCSLSQSTVHEYVSVARASGVQLPIPADWSDHQIEQALFPRRPTPTGRRKHPEPDWPPILEELQKDKDLTLALIWQERRESDPEGYGYSRFCDLYRRWLNKRDLVLRHEHRAGEKMFVDYAGATISIYDCYLNYAHGACRSA